jgi:hypothetical protein
LGSGRQIDGHGLKTNLKGKQKATAGAGLNQPAPFFLRAGHQMGQMKDPFSAEGFPLSATKLLSKSAIELSRAGSILPEG